MEQEPSSDEEKQQEQEISEQDELLQALKLKAEAFADKSWEVYWLSEGPRILASTWMSTYPSIPLTRVEEVCSVGFLCQAVEGMTLDVGQSAMEGMSLDVGQHAVEGTTVDVGQSPAEGMTVDVEQCAVEGMIPGPEHLRESCNQSGSVHEWSGMDSETITSTRGLSDQFMEQRTSFSSTIVMEQGSLECHTTESSPPLAGKSSIHSLTHDNRNGDVSRESY